MLTLGFGLFSAIGLVVVIAAVLWGAWKVGLFNWAKKEVDNQVNKTSSNKPAKK